MICKQPLASGLLLVFSSLAVSSQILLSQAVYAGDVSGILKSQTAYNIHDNQLQQQEWLLDVEYNDSLWNGELTAIGRLRLDTTDELNYADSSRLDTYSAIGGPLRSGKLGEIGLREFYWQFAEDTRYWTIGKQQVVWGEADGLKLLDVINPQSFREFILDDFDDSRIPLWMLNVEFNVTDNGVLQLLWIPDTTTHELAPTTSPFAFSSPVLVPQASPGLNPLIQTPEAPGSPFKDSDFGLRFSDFIGGWDFSINYLYHYVDTPIVRSRVAAGQLFIDQDFARSHLVGGTASTALGDWTLRTEFAYETDRYHRTLSALPGVAQADQWSSVIGLDWQGWSDQFISLQWFQSTITGSTAELISNRREDTMTFLWESKFLNEILTAKWLQIHSLDHGDGIFRPKLSYNYQSNLDIYLGADIFYGNREHLFGQFDPADRLFIGFNWGF